MKKLLLLILLGVSCNHLDDFKYQIPAEYYELSAYTLPQDIEELVPSELVSELFNIDSTDVEVNRNTVSKNKIQSYFIWQEEAFGYNKGVFFSFELNGSRDYGGNYVKDFVYNVKSSGEYNINSDSQSKYSDWPMGSNGAYDIASQTYIWQVHNNVLFKMIINTSHPKEEKLIIAQRIAHSINRAYFSFISRKSI